MTDKDMLAGLVRGLEWDGREAKDAWGGYFISDRQGPDPDVDYYGWSHSDRTDSDESDDVYETQEAAKSAAQADYTARILAALDLDVIRALVGAAYEAAASGADRHRSKIEVNEPIWHEGQDWAAERIAEHIRALTPADAQAAFDAALKKARREGLEMAAIACNAIVARRIYFTEKARDYDAAFAAAIRKLGDGE